MGIGLGFIGENHVSLEGKETTEAREGAVVWHCCCRSYVTVGKPGWKEEQMNNLPPPATSMSGG